MSLLTRQDIESGFERLAQLAQSQGCTLRLFVRGGAAMVLGYDARQSTHDIDALILSPPEARIVREWVKIIASEKGWPEDWLNDAAKGYLNGLNPGLLVFNFPGLEVRLVAADQLLAMKLAAWRDDVDIEDARRLLQKLAAGLEKGELWERVLPFLAEGFKLKAQFAFDDLWESTHGSN